MERGERVKSVVRISSARERPGKHGFILLEPLSYQNFCRVHRHPTQQDLWHNRLMQVLLLEPLILANSTATSRQAPEPPGFWTLGSRAHTQPCLFCQTNFSPICSARIFLSVFFLLWFHQQHPARPSGLPRALQGALSSCPCPAWPSSMNGPEWEMMVVCNTYPSKRRVKEKKTEQNQKIPAELRFWFSQHEAMICARHCARCWC